MEMLIVHWGKVHASHHGFPLFSLPNPISTSVSDLSNRVFNDDIERVSNDEATPAYGGEVGGEGGSCGDADPSGVGPSCEGVYDLPSSSRVVPLEEEEYTPLLTQSHTRAGSSGFDATHFYQYMDDYFSCPNLRLDAIDEWQQQHT